MAKRWPPRPKERPLGASLRIDAARQAGAESAALWAGQRSLATALASRDWAWLPPVWNQARLTMTPALWRRYFAEGWRSVHDV